MTTTPTSPATRPATSPVTTAGVPVRERAEFWADLVSRHVTPMRIVPTGGRPLCGEIRPRPFGDLAVAEVSGAGVHAAHDRTHVARATDHVHAVCVHLEGTARLARRGGTVALAPGDVFVTDSRHPFAFDLDGPWRHLVVTLPAHRLDARVARPEALAGAVVRAHPLARLWAGHLTAGAALAGDLSPAAAALHARHAVDLLVQLLDEASGAGVRPTEATRAATYASACRVIRRELGDPDLTPAAVARAVGVSGRTLARTFAAHGDTVMHRLLDERVREAARLLAAPGAAHRSITDVAFRCGFSDLSHFGRAFAARMHATPSAWRRARS